MLKGKGLTGIFDGEPFWLGSHRYVVERGQDAPEIARQAEALEADGKTVIVIGNPRHVCGLVAVADTVRPEAREIVRQLHAAGIAHVVMLTGDNRITAEAIAREVGIDEVHAELLPEDKVKKLEELIARYGTVAMVGDGVNDAPALARANLGIAMGAIGSDCRNRDGRHRAHDRRHFQTALACPPLQADARNHPSEHHFRSCHKGRVRRADFCRNGEPVGCNRRRHWSIVVGRAQRLAAPQRQGGRLVCLERNVAFDPKRTSATFSFLKAVRLVPQRAIYFAPRDVKIGGLGEHGG